MNRDKDQGLLDKTETEAGNARVTLEVALWVVVGLVALVMRLIDLDAVPLSAAEAGEAMLALRAALGEALPKVAHSPALFALTAPLFWVCGAGDALARLVPALFGVGLVFAPLLLRRRMGRLASLSTGACLALSSTATLVSRQVDGTVLAAVGGMLLVGGVSRFLYTKRLSWLSAAVAGLALAITASPLAYGLIVPLVLARLGLLWAWPSEGKKGEEPVSWWPVVRPHAGHLLVVFLGVGVALATGLGWNLLGLSRVGGLFQAWWSKFVAPSRPTVGALTLLMAYEPLVLVLSLAGLGWAVWRRHRFGVLLAFWAGFALLLLLLMPGRAPVDVLWVVLPLALLSGLAVSAAVTELGLFHENWRVVVHILIVAFLWGHFALRVVLYGVGSSPRDFFLGLLTLALQILLSAAYGVMARPVDAVRGFCGGTLIALLAVTLSASWSVNHANAGDPRELLLSDPAAVEVRDLVDTLESLSLQETGSRTSLEFTFVSDSASLLAWYLRDFDSARRVDGLGSTLTARGGILVTEQRGLDDLEATEPYRGEPFVLRRTWSHDSIRCTWSWPLECRPAAAWLALRTVPSPPVAAEWAVLWMLDTEAAAEAE